MVSTFALTAGAVSCSTGPDPEERFTSFANALQRKDAHAAAAETTDPAAAEPVIEAMFAGMGEAASVSASPVPVDGRDNEFSVDYRWSFGPNREFSYNTDAEATQSGDDWRIAWSPTLLHQDLQPGLTFQYSQDSELQTPVLDRTGQPLLTWQTVGVITLERAQLPTAAALAPLLAPFEPGVTSESISALFNGNTDDRVTVMKLREPDLALVAPALGALPGVTVRQQGELLTADRALSSPALAGLDDYWLDRVTANSGWSVSLVDGSGAPVQRLESTPPKPAEPIRTTLDLRLQLLAQRAVARDPRPAILVALSTGTGGILAAAQNVPADSQGPLAFSGLYPPGSTFKTITSAAALNASLVTPETPVACPGVLTIDNRTIPNDDNFDLGVVPFATAFARSCNTTMGQLADQLPNDALTKMARSFGIGVDYVIPGITTVTGNVPVADTAAQRVENGIGQGTVTVSPFGLAVAEASLAHGATVVPTLIEGETTQVDTPSVPLPPNVTAALRAMMRQTVTEGTATQLQDIPELGGKTGTAEFGDPVQFGGVSPSHGWFAGISGDIAFATLVVGGDSSAPALTVTGDFLRSAAGS
ncbi:penicillin-binding protein [Mycobacterium sp. MS1601]|uniref:penicillin-binding transpeptidase domain-containing protein n=1 Tax=Mycobacterium sp. MS1601 TaxID=1936029 RepID=UPI0009794CC0|nr:penicillin-binding transpeptidase domain-containing protein [Mycobacterium sp. MS1601]AQA01131.1 penicillin-binding protein [Mycobacterium sp. MS1601]